MAKQKTAADSDTDVFDDEPLGYEVPEGATVRSGPLIPLTSRQEEIIASQNWRMPVPKDGLVIWRSNPENREVTFGLVTKITPRTIDVVTFNESQGIVLHREVRHRDDPGVRLIADMQYYEGCWEPTPFQNALVDLQKRVAAIEGKVK